MKRLIIIFAPVLVLLIAYQTVWGASRVIFKSERDQAHVQGQMYIPDQTEYYEERHVTTTGPIRESTIYPEVGVEVEYSGNPSGRFYYRSGGSGYYGSAPIKRPYGRERRGGAYNRGYEDGWHEGYGAGYDRSLKPTQRLKKNMNRERFYSK